MKTRDIIFFVLVSLFVCTSCSKPDFASEPLTSVTNNYSFVVNQSNSDNDYVSKAVEILETEIEEDWRLLAETDSVQITRETLHKVRLENDKIVEIGFWFLKREESSSLLLMDQISDPGFPSHGTSWRYKTYEDIVEKFYQDNKCIRILVNGNVIFKDEAGQLTISVENKLLQDGIEKPVLRIDFEGTAHGWYDPKGEHSTVYILENGSFTGVLE